MADTMDITVIHDEEALRKLVSSSLFTLTKSIPGYCIVFEIPVTLVRFSDEKFRPALAHAFEF